MLDGHNYQEFSYNWVKYYFFSFNSYYHTHTHESICKSFPFIFSMLNTWKAPLHPLHNPMTFLGSMFEACLMFLWIHLSEDQLAFRAVSTNMDCLQCVFSDSKSNIYS